MAKVDANDVAARAGPEGLRAESEARARAAEAQAIGSRPLTIEHLLHVDTEKDPNCLIGRRWLCRGGSCLWVGQSGIGKSSLQMQAALCWALGRPFFGMHPVRPLRSVIIQAENDEGDLAEQVKGAFNGISFLAGQEQALQRQLLLFNEAIRTGPKLTTWLKLICSRYKPDLLWLDPLMAYLGGDVSDQALVSQFLRGQLGPIAKQFDLGLMVMHHTGKPPKDPRAKNAWSGSDLAYYGIGSSELTNWARAVMVLRELSEGRYELRAAKRGTRAGLRDLNPATGFPVDAATLTVTLAHGAEGICWEQLPSETPAAPLEMDDDAFAALLNERFTPRKRVLDLIRSALACRLTDAEFVLDAINARHELDALMPIEGPRSCGAFNVQMVNRGIRYARTIS